MEGVNELGTRPTPSSARTADTVREHTAWAAEGSDGDGYGRPVRGSEARSDHRRLFRRRLSVPIGGEMAAIEQGCRTTRIAIREDKTCASGGSSLPCRFHPG